MNQVFPGPAGHSMTYGKCRPEGRQGEKWPKGRLFSGVVSLILTRVSEAIPPGAHHRTQGAEEEFRALLVPVRDAPPREVVGRHLDLHTVTLKDANVVLAHLAR